MHLVHVSPCCLAYSGSVQFFRAFGYNLGEPHIHNWPTTKKMGVESFGAPYPRGFLFLDLVSTQRMPSCRTVAEAAMLLLSNSAMIVFVVMAGKENPDNGYAFALSLAVFSSVTYGTMAAFTMVWSNKICLELASAWDKRATQDLVRALAVVRL